LAGRLAGKTALITGAASGIGAAAARRFVEEGARVLLADVQADKGRALAEELGGDFVTLDVTREADWGAAAVEAQNRFGGLTTLFHSAGISEPAHVENETLAHFQRTMAINTEAAFLAARTAVPLMKAGCGGSIVLVASTMGARGGDFLIAYAASKWAVRGIVRATALHCARAGYDIRCNAILPGAIHTEMVERYVESGEAAGATREQVLGGFASQHPLNRLGTPREAADAVVFLASDESSFITGVDLPVDGGFLA
jgi:3alpha(or 20beta)-hydroxysteroid dehydrogenase